MPNIVETVFSSKDTGIVETIDKINTKLPEIVRSSQAAGAGIDTLELKMRRLAAIASNHNVEISKADYAALRSKGIPAIDAAIEKIQRATDAQRAQTRETERTAEANRKVEQAASRIRAQEARTAQIARESSPATRSTQFAAPEVAAASAYERTAQGFDKATQGAQRLNRGASELRQSLISLSGVPYPEAANQLSKLLSGSLAGTVAITAIAAIGAAVVSQINSIEEATEKAVKNIREAANFGVSGGFDQRRKDLEELRDVLRELEERRALGDTNPEAAINERLQKIVKVEPGFRKNDLINAIFGETIRTGAAASETELRIAIEKQEKIINDFSDKQREKLRTQQDFLDARRANINPRDTKGLIDIEREQKRIKDLQGRYGIDDLNPSKAAIDAREKDFEDFVNKHAQGSDKIFQVDAKVNEAAIRAIRSLRDEYDNNPYVSLFDRANQRLQDFQQQFKGLGQEIVSQFAKVNDQVLALEIFKLKLNQATQISDTLTERAKLEAGLGGQALRDAQTRNQADRAAILKEIEDKRGAGTLTGAQQDALLAKLNNVGTQGPLQRVQQESVDRQIAIANSALASAQTAEQKRLAIESGLGATRDIGNLTASQVDARAKFLDQSLAIQQDALREQREREDRLANSQERFASALENFSDQFGQSVGILSGATDQLKDGVNLNIKSDDGIEFDLGSVDPNASFHQGRIGNTRSSGSSLTENF
jgi:hypothetical protein